LNPAMRLHHALYGSVLILFMATACTDHDLTTERIAPVPETSLTVSGKAVIKVLPDSKGWMTIQETLQQQYLFTVPQREISWLNADFSETRKYTSPEGWALIDAIVHPSGQTSAVSVHLDFTESYALRIRLSRFKADGSEIQFELDRLLLPPGPHDFVFPGSMDRVRLVAFGEDVYVVARWADNEVQAYRLSFDGSTFHTRWVQWVEPTAFIGSLGIIGGGFDNFHQGDNSFFVYPGIDSKGNLYVVIPSTEDVLTNHDAYFHETLMASANPESYDFGLAIVTKFSPEGNRLFATLAGSPSRYKRLLNMRVSDGGIHMVGRIKTGTEANSWDAWILTVDPENGSIKYESNIDIADGDMLWDINPLSDGSALAVGTTGYTQNPSGLSVSDTRSAAAFLLDNQGKIVKQIPLPQGPSERGSEAMSVNLIGQGKAVFSGVHNAPGTHATVYADGFIAIRNF
jgi:hypothetical protein